MRTILPPQRTIELFNDLEDTLAIASLPLKMSAAIVNKTSGLETCDPHFKNPENISNISDNNLLHLIFSGVLSVRFSVIAVKYLTRFLLGGYIIHNIFISSRICKFSPLISILTYIVLFRH